MSASNRRAGSGMAGPNRRQFLALAGALAGSPLVATEMRAQRGKTLAQIKREASLYASALSSLSASPTAIATYRATSERVGVNLKHRFSWLVAQVAQDSRLAEALKPHFASEDTFKRFATTIAGNAPAILNLPGVRQAAADALARDAQNRRVFASAVTTFAAMITKEATRLQTRLRDEDIRATLSKIEDSQSARLVQVVALVAVAVVLASIAATLPAAGGTAANAATLAAMGATVAIVSVAAAAAVARIAAGAVTAAAESAASQAGASAEAIAACVDAAAARRTSCLSSVSGTPAERETQAAYCQYAYLVESALCPVTA